jgi:hypothetical protein
VLDLVALARTTHGHLGLLAAVALLHPALTLRPGPLRRGTRWSAGLATGLLTAVLAGGAALYPAWRHEERPRLWQHAPWLGRLFETKEHFAFYALVLSWCGLLLLFRGGDAAGARRAYIGAAALAWVVGTIGTLESAFR